MTETEAGKDGNIVFELCAETLQACRVARTAGAARIEFCAELAVDGLTPSPALTQAAVVESGLPVHMLLRPRAGDFVYTAAEFAAMRQDLLAARALGVSGYALGVLLPDGRVDIERTRELVELAAPLDITFHRAFDATPDLSAALEDVLSTGCRRILTSGGAADVTTGADTLAALVRQAAGRIEIAAGGGIRPANARALAQRTGARHFHGSLRHTHITDDTPGQHAANGAHAAAAPSLVAGASASIDPQAIHRVIEELRRGIADRHVAAREHTSSTRT